MTNSWGNLNPNSANQFWSRWTFTINEPKHAVPFKELVCNVARWLKKGFGSVGQAKVDATKEGYRIVAVVEGVPAHDPYYIVSVQKAFAKFIDNGWRTTLPHEVYVKVLAGDKQDGKPPAQLIVVPSIAETAKINSP